MSRPSYWPALIVITANAASGLRDSVRNRHRLFIWPASEAALCDVQKELDTAPSYSAYAPAVRGPGNNERRSTATETPSSTMPPQARMAPVQPVASSPKPSATTTPPAHAPRAFAILKAEWLSAAATVWASPATSIRRVCTAGTTAMPSPIAKRLSVAVHSLADEYANAASAAAFQISMPKMVQRRDLSARTPPIKLPAVMPTPSAPSSNGTRHGATWVTFSSVGVM